MKQHTAVPHPQSTSSHSPRIGDWKPTPSRFKALPDVIHSFEKSEFQSLTERKKFKAVNRSLLQLIEESPSPCFLLPAVFDYISQINEKKILKEPYSFSLFEFWLNHFSKLTPDENLRIRGKIVGRLIPRDEYQALFPIGMNKYFPGSHFVAAHLSPDVDTTVASFVGWLDAFGARVSEGIHQWSLPNGFSDGFIINLFDSFIAPRFIKTAPRETTACTLTALDLVSKKNFHKVSVHARGDSIEHGSDDHAYIVVDDEGCYRGEWRSSDAESVRIVLSAFSNCLRWFENAIQRSCIHSLAEESVLLDHIEGAIEKQFEVIIKDSDPVKELSDRSRKLFNEYLKKILGVSSGLGSPFKEFIQKIDETFHSHVEKEIKHFIRSIFNKIQENKNNAQNRLQALEILEKTILSLSQEINKVRDSAEKLEHLLLIKDKVLGISNQYVFLKSSVEEMKNRTDHAAHLTVLVPEINGSSFPVGVVWTNDLHKPILGTASLRDFSNLEETKMASYIDVISIIDHHKSAIKTSQASTLVLGDAQSSNTLIAELSLAINSRWSSISDDEISPWLLDLMNESEEIYAAVSNALEKGKTQGSKTPSYTFVHREREIIEYMLFILAILDDTDLLSKVSRRDVLCLEKLLNRIASLINGKPVKVISFDDIPHDASFTKNAAKRLLHNEELYSIYKNVYQFREKEIEKTLVHAAEGKPSPFFADTKEQNGCCKIGQTKLFERNMPTYQELRSKLIRRWLEEAQKTLASSPHVDFFLHMISTVPGEKEVRSGNDITWAHSDEIWLWAPDSNIAEEHLSVFLTLFQNSSTGQALSFDIIVEGKETEKRYTLANERFPRAKSIQKKVNEELAISEKTPAVIVLQFTAGQINSRKSQISPFLPKYVP